jgi:diadenosine tetraphosphatase ApaH/serine/threonine PP2A family protein phosphatase
VKLALISDIHANLEALEAVLEDVRAAKVSAVRSLGDLVGYGADPDACVARVREVASVSLLGNHDAVAIGERGDAEFNDLARDAIRWTKSMLSAESVSYLRGLPLEHREEDCLFSHAHPVHPEEWTYVFPGQHVEEIFESVSGRLLFVGHTHVSAVANDRANLLHSFPEGKLRLEEGVRYLINVGSVGQPRDRDPRAAWGLLDLEASTYEQRRVEYDVLGAQRRILASGLPGLLADRLERGF